MDSQAARTELQERAIDLTLQHPLLGVGALMFADAVEEMVRANLGSQIGMAGRAQYLPGNLGRKRYSRADFLCLEPGALLCLELPRL